MNKYQRAIQKITYLGFFLVAAFAVKSFQDAVPDQIYVKIGEEVSYDFNVPVSVVLKNDSAEVFESLTAISAAPGESCPSYIVTCRFFWLFPVKDVVDMLV